MRTNTYCATTGRRYAHFNKSFWSQVRAEPGIEEEVRELRGRVATLSQRCQNQTLLLPEHEVRLYARVALGHYWGSTRAVLGQY